MRRRYHHGDLRAVLLEHAERTLAEQGVSALSLRELARDIGVSHAAPRRHFRDKESLLDALALNAFHRLEQELAEAPATGGFADRVTALGVRYVRFAMDNAGLVDVMWTKKRATEDLRSAFRSACAVPLELIDAARDDGELIERDADRIGLTLFALVHGLAGLAASGVLPADDVPEAVANAVEDLIHGLGKPL